MHIEWGTPRLVVSMPTAMRETLTMIISFCIAASYRFPNRLPTFPAPDPSLTLRNYPWPRAAAQERYQMASASILDASQRPRVRHGAKKFAVRQRDDTTELHATTHEDTMEMRKTVANMNLDFAKDVPGAPALPLAEEPLEEHGW